MNIENIQESIKRYVDGKMSQTESLEFEQLLEINTDLREELRLYKALAFITKNRDLMAMSQIVGNVIQNEKLKPDFDAYQTYLKKPKKWWQRGLWILSSFIALALTLGIIYTVNIQQDRAKYENLVQNYGHLPDDLIQADSASVLYDALQFYRAKNYPNAKTAFKKHLKKQPNDDLAQLYLGVTEYLTHENTEGVKTLRQVVANSDDFSKKYAQMSLSMALLKVGEYTEAQTLLEQLKSDAILGEKVQGILSDLKKK